MNYFPKKRPSASEAIEAQAAAWLAERDAGFTPAAAEKFSDWCAADRRHAAAVHRLEKAWTALQSLRDYRPTARAHPDPDLLSPKRRRSMSGWFYASVTLPFAAMLLLAAAWWKTASPPVEGPTAQNFATTMGGYQRVALEDGSVVELNSNTEVRVNYSTHERRLELLRGEAHFTVAQNRQRPFWVAADGVTVRAVGTAFDVRVAPQGIEVLVTAGTVQLGRASASGSVVAPGSSDSAPLVTAGWRATVPRAENAPPSIEKVGSPVVRDLLAWQSSRLVFVEMPLGEVIEQFNQRNQVQLSLADPELAKMPVGGSFAADNVETFVRLLSSNGDLIAEQTSPEQIVLRKAH